MVERVVLAEVPPPAIPATQFRYAGEKVIGAVADVTELQDRDYNTGKPKTWDNGDPVMVTRVTLVVTQTRENVHAADEPINGGDNVRVWIRGQNRTAWRTALRAHRVGLEVGQIVTAAYLKDEQTRRGWNPRKVLGFNIRGPRTAEEQEAGEKAAELFEQLNRPRTPVPSPAETQPTAELASETPEASHWEGNDGPPPRWGPAPAVPPPVVDDEPF